MRSYVLGAFSKPTPVVTWMPSAIAVMWPVYRPCSSCAGSTPTGTVAVPRAGTVSVPLPTVTSASDEEIFNSTALSVVLVYVMSLVAISVSPSSNLPKLSVGVAKTFCPTARTASTRPSPCSNTELSAFVFAVVARASLICRPVQSGCACATSAAAPATCGVAIDVPFAVV